MASPDNVNGSIKVTRTCAMRVSSLHKTRTFAIRSVHRMSYLSLLHEQNVALGPSWPHTSLFQWREEIKIVEHAHCSLLLSIKQTTSKTGRENNYFGRAKMNKTQHWRVVLNGNWTAIQCRTRATVFHKQSHIYSQKILLSYGSWRLLAIKKFVWAKDSCSSCNRIISHILSYVQMSIQLNLSLRLDSTLTELSVIRSLNLLEDETVVRCRSS